MPEAAVEMNVRDAAPGVRIIEINGDVTAFAEPVLGDAFAQASTGDVNAIVLDFAGMEYMNSSGIGLLVTTLIRAQRNKQELRAVGLDDHYREIMSLTRLDEAIKIYDDHATAVADG